MYIYIYIYVCTYMHINTCIYMYIPVAVVGVGRGGDAFRGLVVPGELAREAVHASLHIPVCINKNTDICFYLHIHI